MNIRAADGRLVLGAGSDDMEQLMALMRADVCQYVIPVVHQGDTAVGDALQYDSLMCVHVLLEMYTFIAGNNHGR